MAGQSNPHKFEALPKEPGGSKQLQQINVESSALNLSQLEAFWFLYKKYIY